MKIALAVQLFCASMLIAGSAAAQRTYSFEEACRNMGSTTGPCAPKSQQQQPLGCIKLGGSAFHADKAGGGCLKTTLSPGYDASIFVELLGLPNLQKVNELRLTIGRSSGFKNAVALFHNGSRMIIHDPEWAKIAAAEFYLVLGHEAGHHLCGHTVASAERTPKEAELEADRFSGAAIRRFEVYHGRRFFKDALKAASELYSEGGSRSHPPRAARLDAIRAGYGSGSPCGNLAPAIRGFSPQPR